MSLLGKMLLALSVITLVVSQEYYITPNLFLCNSTNKNCYTLEQLHRFSLHNEARNVTLIFREGVHTLSQPLSIISLDHVQMIGQNGSEICFIGNSLFRFSNINQLTIIGLAFTGHVQRQQSYLITPSHRLSIINSRSLVVSRCYFTNLDTKRFIVFVWRSVNTVIQNVVFKENNGTQLAFKKPENTVSIENTKFTGNHGLNGGAIFIESASKNIMINNSVFIHNHAQKGGAICSLHAPGVVFISNSSFVGNSAKYGGGLYLNQSNASITDSAFLRNRAKQDGGGIYVSQGNASISNSVLIKNIAENDGGGIDAFQGTVSIFSSNLLGNRAERNGGGIEVYQANANVSGNSLSGNTANQDGGGIFIYQGSVHISNNNLSHNNAKRDGGGIHAYQGTASISENNLIGNIAKRIGGGIKVYRGIANISRSSLLGNTAKILGAGVSAQNSSLTICTSNFIGNNAEQDGGGIVVLQGNVSISHSKLIQNRAKWTGGGIAVHLVCSLEVSYCNFTDNSAGDLGSAISVTSSQSIKITGTYYTNNSGVSSLTFFESQHVTLSGNNTIYNNVGSFYVFRSQVYFNGETVIKNNQGILSRSGGAIHAVQSQIFLNRALTMFNNTAADNGGGLFMIESSLFVMSPLNIIHNTARDGGAMYASHSSIEFINTGHYSVNLTRNYAYGDGGGMYAIASVIKLTKSYITIESNRAEANGGGLYLQQDSRLYILKQFGDKPSNLESKVTISKNYAVLGGGIYVDDSTTSGRACGSRSGFFGECFIQTMLLYSDRTTINTVNTFITHNNAKQSGSSIYGGLLDRCKPSFYGHVEVANVSGGLEYIKNIIELPIDDHSVSSDPLQVRLCDSVSPNLTVFSRKGHSIRLYVTAIDQAGNSVNATIRGNVVTQSGVGRLKEGQVEQEASSKCTELEYNVFSEDNFAQVELYAHGPCNDLGPSKLTFNIIFLNCTCPPGFHSSLDQSNIECSCECDTKLQATECFPDDDTFERDNSLWIGTADCNETEYVVHYCPFDYCIHHPVNISLNSSQLIDRQCANNRTGILCGECNEGLSLVLATSKCAKCSNIFLLLLLPFAAAGIVLVALILWLNITIATGTIYGLIFYANIVAANKAIFLPFTAPNFLTVFISWINLDLGIQTCFYSGMTSQVKVLLQLTFPAYLHILIFLIITLCKYVNSFAKVLSNRNPVAALCTLFILSYSKSIRIIIDALQFSFLDCSHSSYRQVVWLYDANVQYFSPSHIPRFVAAAIVLTACALFTTLLFFGQCFPRCSNWKVMKWTKNTKYIGFMDAFHAPFTPKHRYWVGLLLFALIASNLAASMAPGTLVPVLLDGCIAGGLIVYSKLAKKVYKNWFNDLLETLCLLNIIILSLVTLTIKNNHSVQRAVSYTSISIAFIIFLVIVCHHFYKYVLKKTHVYTNQMRAFHPPRARWQIRRNYKNLAENDNLSSDSEYSAFVDAYCMSEHREETDCDPNRYITPPIIRPASRPDKLREPDLDILSPITTKDYEQSSNENEINSRPVVTHTVVNINGK